MNEKSTELVIQYLNELGEKLGVGAEKIWPWYIKQVYIDSIVSTGFFLVSISAFVWCFIFSIKHWKRHGDRYSICGNGHEPIWAVALILTGVLAFISVCGLLIAGLNFLNPELHAFKDILSSLK